MGIPFILGPTIRTIEETTEERAKITRRELYLFELRETRWAAYHLNFPQNTRGFGPWANEQISFSEARKGSLLGYGFIDNPLNETEAERRATLARDQNRIRAQTRDAFNRGDTFEQIKAALGGNDSALVPRDLARHYGLPDPQTAIAQPPRVELPWYADPFNLAGTRK